MPQSKSLDKELSELSEQLTALTKDMDALTEKARARIHGLWLSRCDDVSKKLFDLGKRIGARAVYTFSYGEKLVSPVAALSTVPFEGLPPKCDFRFLESNSMMSTGMDEPVNIFCQLAILSLGAREMQFHFRRPYALAPFILADPVSSPVAGFILFEFETLAHKDYERVTRLTGETLEEVRELVGAPFMTRGRGLSHAS